MLDDQDAPAGCVVDQDSRVYFNQKGSRQSGYMFVKSLCKWKTVAGFVLPAARTEVVDACGKTKKLPVYRVIAEDFERTVNELRNSAVRRYAIQLTAGTALLTKPLTLLGDVTQEVVIAGQHLLGLANMAQPPTASEIRTHIDLGKRNIAIANSASVPQAEICMMDLRLHNGKVLCTQAKQSPISLLPHATLCFTVHALPLCRPREEVL